MPTFALAGAVLITAIIGPIMWVVHKAKKRDKKFVAKMNQIKEK